MASRRWIWLIGLLVILPFLQGAAYTIYDYTQPEHKAFEGEFPALPTTYLIGSEMDAENYSALQFSDDIHAYYSTPIDDEYEFHRFAIKIDEPIEGKQMCIEYEGYAVSSDVGLELYIWNNTSASWEEIGYNGEDRDIIIRAYLKGDISHYLNETNYVNVLAKSEYTPSSCPFYYSYDGSKYILDGEGLISAFLPWFEKDSIVTLENLKPVNGKYRVKITEELDETSYLDKISLIIAEHSPDVKVYPDFNNNLHTIKEPIEPISAIDSDGNDCIDLMQKDDVYWLPMPDFEKFSDVDGDGIIDGDESDFYKWIELEYPKPAGVTKAKLLCRLKGGHLLVGGWDKFMKIVGKNNLHILKDKYGDILQEWLAFQMASLEVWNGEEWVEVYRTMEATTATKGNNKVIPIDLTNINTDTLKIRFKTLAGFQGIDYAWIDYTEDEPIDIIEVEPISLDKGDITKILYDDGDYLVLKTGDAIYVEFPEIQSNGMARTYLIKDNGYYLYNIKSYVKYDKDLEEFLNQIFSDYLYAYRYLLSIINKEHQTIYTDFIRILVFEPKVINIDTGEEFTTLQEAIDDVDTQDGHTLFACVGIYDGCIINKSLTIIGGDKNYTVILGMAVIESDDVTIYNFTFTGGETGIFINRSNCLIEECNFTDLESGILINNSQSNLILYNEFYGNEFAIAMNSSMEDIIYGNKFTYNSGGILLLNASNEYIYNNDFYYHEAPIYAINSTYIYIAENTMIMWGFGVLMQNCSWSTVTYNYMEGYGGGYGKLEDGEGGVELLPSGILIYEGESHNMITYNEIMDTEIGIYLYNTSSETIISNNITNCSEAGIVMIYSSYNHAESNNIINCCMNVVIGYNASYNELVNNNISYGECGIYLVEALYTNITSNYIANNTGDTGIYIDEGCSHINIAGNTICNNDIGIYVYGGLPPYENKDTEIHWNKIYNNSIYGLIYEIEEGETPFINATYNFWGNGNGPSNSSMIDPITGIEAQGTGDAIGGGIANNNIHFDPWIGKLILHKGWNTICLPIWNDSIATAEDLGQYINSIAGYNICTVITKWDSSKQRFVSHIVGFGGNFDLKAGEGYFIFMKNAMNISINGTIIEPEVNITLHIGYNLVGWCRIYPTNAYEIINETNAEKIGRWLNEEQKWDVEVIPPAPYNFDVIIGDAVFIKMLSPGEWNS